MELTAGGGGATDERKKKIVERNQRVGEQRVKRKEREAEEEGEEGGEGETTIGEDGEPVKKKTKVRGGRRGKAVSVRWTFHLMLKITIGRLINARNSISR